MLKFSYLILIVALVQFVVSSPQHKPKSCIEVKEYLNPTENNYFNLFDANGNMFKAFCDFETEPPFVWTLVESLTLQNSQNDMYRKSFGYNVPLAECSTGWGLYRLQAKHMQSILSSYGSTHYRATCNFDINVGTGLVNRNDYIRFSACRNGKILQTSSTQCTYVDYINVRGYACRQCFVPLYGSSTQHLHIDLTTAATTGCSGKDFVVPDRVSSEDIFGNYLNPNPSFSCAANANATTNWWIGGIYLG